MKTESGNTPGGACDLSASDLRQQAENWERRGEAEYAAGDMVAAHDCWQKAQALLTQAAGMEAR